MSGLNEIIQWTEDNIDFERGEDPTGAFEFIDNEFTRDNRLPLADILGSDIGKYLEFIEEKTGTTAEENELRDLERRAEELNEEIRQLEGMNFNILGTPIR